MHVIAIKTTKYQIQQRSNFAYLKQKFDELIDSKYEVSISTDSIRMAAGELSNISIPTQIRFH